MPNLVNGLLSGGHQTDMNHLWQVVQQLSDVLAENRSQTASIMGQVQQMQVAESATNPTPTTATNGELPSLPPHLQPAHAANAAELHALRTQLASTTTALTSMETQNASLHALLSDYETSLALTLEKLRPFAYRHAEALLALHAHYNALLDRERQANLALRLEHQEWQAGLGRVAGLARAALKEGVDGGMGWERRERELKAENRVLRRLVGWEVGSEDSEDEGDEGEGLGL
ncbi:uncharacterized protein K452DRAFT_334842 [Aplosporella prunicola CBS 121167]|uniref:Uncharacterized protein n=1 Tax=Aplosporella prunicola CBS 121167 TaxID=1176127 RepID=A0A6A6BAV4_9PEZI|nr:uncharacterized protein K452DRAFT_334842 [Aplosporella prunicola CBS 121167]KAF2140493.1 hypothetical protein K452DRAFT_334842 [Aplosporella prunicola CBS 121167]